jgi:23S rRNA (adenine1618-N6)-methyltransferase
MADRKQTASRDPGTSAEKPGLHPRNRHRERYDFPQLVKSCPELGPFVAQNPYGDLSIDFANPDAVRTLNRALLAHFYGVGHWEIPKDYLCPPIPGRADYLHHLADLLASCNAGGIPRGESICVLDIGSGANCIYPILGNREYDWRFVGSEVDARALAAAKRILQANQGLAQDIELRLQRQPGNIFSGILQPGEVFDLSMCNPPFHASLSEAREGTQRKWRNLGREESIGKRAPMQNFGGQGAELWCPGGEAVFVERMIEESAAIPNRCLWFTTLLSKSSHLPRVRAVLKRAAALEVRIIEMAQGQKKSRIVAWTFLDEAERQAWRKVRWQQV